MTTITIDINDSLLSNAIIESQAKQVSLSDFINNSLEIALTEKNITTKQSINVEDILQKAVERVIELEAGERFSLIDVCKKENWDAINGGARKQFGKMFRKAAEGGATVIANHVGRTKSNLAIYERA